MIVREEVRVTIFDEHCQGHSPSERLRLHPGTHVHVEKSAYGFEDCLLSCTIDAIDLAKLMEGERWKDEREKSHDWLLIECRARNYFETHGSPKTDQQIADQVLAMQAQSAMLDHEPTISTLRKLISELRTEYEFYDYRCRS